MVGCSFLIAHWSVGWVNSPYKAYDYDVQCSVHLDIGTFGQYGIGDETSIMPFFLIAQCQLECQTEFV